MSGVIQGEALYSLSASLQRRANISCIREQIFHSGNRSFSQQNFCDLLAVVLRSVCWFPFQAEGDEMASESCAFSRI